MCWVYGEVCVVMGEWCWVSGAVWDEVGVKGCEVRCVWCEVVGGAVGGVCGVW